MQQQIGKYLEDIELARGEVALENMGDVTLENLKAKIVENRIVAKEAITDIIPSDGSEVTQAKILTKEGYIFVITAKTSEYAGSGDKIPTPPEITQANIEFEITKDGEKVEGWTKGPVQVAIKRKASEVASINETNPKLASTTKIATRRKWGIHITIQYRWKNMDGL